MKPTVSTPVSWRSRASSSVDGPAGRRWLGGLWRLADPKISLASFASLVLGACAAAAAGPLDGGWLALTVLAVFAIEVAKNASGEVFDFDSGADLAVAERDRSPFSGGKRVLVDGLLSRGQTIRIAAAGYGIAIALGLGIALAREPGVLAFGAVGLLLAYGYHAPPLRLSYRGLGEVAVGIVYGPLICAGTYLVQRGSVPIEVWLLAIPLGLLVAAFLWVNEIPDSDSDRSVGKLTLVARMGRRRASRVFVALVALAFASLLALPMAGWPRTIWLGLAGAAPAFGAARALLGAYDSTSRIVPAQRATLISFVVLAIAMGLAILLRGAGG
jgi:1,4-dihydroxy-2-naphthoate octaprenyltransferase